MTTTAKKKTTKKDPLELPLKPFAFEVLHLASKQRSKAKKVEVLKRYEDPSLKALFIWNFDETIYLFYQKVKFLTQVMMNRHQIVEL